MAQLWVINMIFKIQSLSFKVLGMFLVLTVLSVGALNYMAYTNSSRIFERQTLSAMQSILTFRGDMLSTAMEQFRSQAVSVAKIESMQSAIVSLRSGWGTLAKTGNPAEQLIATFVTANPFPVGEREKLIKPEGASVYYYMAHEKTQIDVANILKGTAFTDLLVVEPEGNVVYSYKKADNFAANLKDGKWAETSLGKTFGKALDNAAKATEDNGAEPAFSGIAIDEVTGRSGIFYAVPIVKLGAIKGVIVLQLGDEPIVQTLTKGLNSKSSEAAVLMSADGQAIMPFEGTLKSLDAAPFGEAAARVEAGEQGMIHETIRLDDVWTEGYFRPIVIDGRTLMIVETVDRKEIYAGSVEIARNLLLIGIGALAMLAAATAFFTNRLFAPLTELAGLTRAVSEGKLDAEIANQNRKDEIGTMARALGRFRQSLLDQRKLETDAEAERSRTEQERQARLAEKDAEARTLQRVVQSLDTGLSQLAGGDLSYQISEAFPAELESLRINFNHAISTLNATLSAIGGNSNAVRSSSRSMSSGADQLATRTERQAVSIGQTANAINAITEAVRTQITRGEQAERIAGDAKKGTQESGRIMQDTISAMEEIQNSSRQINQIINVIDEIAFQTNLLALNAGVEAARAGESGKGFAVVAQEVRELAQRSSKAAKEISTLLQKSTADVENGVALVEKAGNALQNIGGFVEAINERLHEIIESTREEAETLKSINSAVAELDQVTQQNAAMVEESTAAIHQLAAEAGEMDEQLGQFRLVPLSAGADRRQVDYRRSA